MFKHIGATPDEVVFTFEGSPVRAASRDTIASALLANQECIFRSSVVSQSARGPFCMMGVCFECLVEVDGVPNRQACMVPVREGMAVRRQRAGTSYE